MKPVKPEYLETFEFMLDDYGIEPILNALADALIKKATWVEATHAMPEQGKIYRLQAEALRAQGQALTAGRALLYATQAPLQTALRGPDKDVSYALDILFDSEKTPQDCERFARRVANIFRREDIFEIRARKEIAMNAIKGKRFR